MRLTIPIETRLFSIQVGNNNLKRVHLATTAVLRHSSLFAVSSALLTLAPFALADDVSPNGDRRLGTVTVQAAKQTDVQAAKAKLDEVAGGTSPVTQAEVEKGRSATLKTRWLISRACMPKRQVATMLLRFPFVVPALTPHPVIFVKGHQVSTASR